MESTARSMPPPRHTGEARAVSGTVGWVAALICLTATLVAIWAAWRNSRR